MDQAIESAAREIWDYMQLRQKPNQADCLIILGSRDDRVAVYAAELARIYSYDHIVITGGVAHRNDLLATKWTSRTEAEHFEGVMRHEGLKQPILLEKEATNTGENASYTHALLQNKGLSVKDVLLVTKPYMERRAKATFDVQWPDTHAAIRVTSPPIVFDEYFNDAQPVDVVLNIMVGDLQRIIHYPSLGYQSEQTVPQAVLGAMNTLISAGYTKHLVTTM